MMANYFILKTEADKERVINYIPHIDLAKAKKISITNYVRDRSKEQNDLQMLWIQFAERQLEGNTFSELRALCKLNYGVPILCRDDEEYRREYDIMFTPLPYELKIKFILHHPVTRKMNVKQMMEYTDRITQFFLEQGVNIPMQTEER